MKHASVHSKSTQQSTAVSPHRPITGRDGISIVPPTYGINFVDRQQSTDAGMTIQRQTREDSSIPERQQENRTGLSDHLKTGIETLSGLSLDDVHVHYNSTKPAALQALAYTQGTDIYVAPGQEPHLPHEAWHVVQQAQGRVKPTIQAKGVGINDDAGLEHEADVMGAKAMANSKREVDKTAAAEIKREEDSKRGEEKSEQQRIVTYNHSSADEGTRGEGSMIQLYTKVPGKGKQGGNFIYGNQQIHLHIDIGIKSHLKIEGQTIGIAKKGGLLDTAKIQDALNRLLQFQKNIAQDKPRANTYETAIQDCIEWLTEHGAKMPLPEETKPEEKKEEEKSQNKGYDDFFANVGKGAPVNEDDFM